MATFMVNLYCENSGNEMGAEVEYDCTAEEAAAILNGSFGEDFIRATFDRISIIPVVYYDADDEDDDDEDDE
jgi:hypothetical protein